MSLDAQPFQSLLFVAFFLGAASLSAAELSAAEPTTTTVDDRATIERLRKAGLVLTETSGMVTGAFIKNTVDMTDDDFAALGSLKHLKTLQISSNKLNDRTLGLLTGMTALEALLTDSAQFSDAGLAQLTKFLNLKNISFIHTSLKRDDFTGTGLAALAAMPNLRRLVVGGCKFNDEGMAAVASLTQLEELRVGHTYQTEAGNVHLKALGNLKILSLGQSLQPNPNSLQPLCLTEATLNVLVELKSLETLELSQGRFTADALARLRALPNLKRLRLDQVDIPAADVAKLKAALPNVAIDWKPLSDEDRATLDKFLKRKPATADGAAAAPQAKPNDKVAVDDPLPKEGDWETLPDGTTGRTTTFQGKDGMLIGAYLRKPKGEGPFPVVVIFHGAGPNLRHTYVLGRANNQVDGLGRYPIADFVAAGWAIYSMDYASRPNRKLLEEIEVDDFVLGIEALRRVDFIDPQRLALFGHSHGGNLVCRMAARIDAACGVPGAPAFLDYAETAKAARSGVKVGDMVLKLLRMKEEELGGKAEEMAENPTKYGYHTALMEVDKVRFPLLILNGRNDPASPIPVADAYVAKLKAADKEIETYFPDDGKHSICFRSWDDHGPVSAETKESVRLTTAFIKKHFDKVTASSGAK
jgi:acetyl esterase/lipase